MLYMGSELLRPLRHGAAAALIGFSAFSCNNGAAPTKTAELIFTNAKVYTVEDNQPWAEAVAISDGKILAVGASEDIAELQASYTRVVDLEGRLLMPAFGDAHVHPVLGGIAFSRCSLHDGESLEDYQEIIADCVAASPGDGPVFGMGWEDSLFPPNGVPRKEVLDAVTTERALIFKSVGGHTYWVNSKTLELAGIDKDTPDPANGHIDRDEESGEPVGGLQEAARDLVEYLIPKPTAEEMQQSIIYTAEHFNSLGIVSWHDAGIDLAADGSSEILDAYKAVSDQGALNVHATIALTWANERTLDQIPVIADAAARAEAWGLRAKAVKYYVDGVIPQRTAAMIEPYEGGGAERGELQIDPDILDEAATQLGAMGIQAHFHAIGDRGVRVSLDAIEESNTRNGTNRRPMISHLNVIDPEDQSRFGALGAIAVFQPTWASSYPYMDLTRQAIGPVRSNYIYPANSVAKSGGILAYGADWPVATADPLLGLEVAVTRTNYEDPASGPLLPEEGVTLEEAVRAHTINVAYANHMEEITGSIAPGKSADLIVIDTDIFSVPPTDISDANVILTLFKGESVYGEFEQFDTGAAD